MSQKKEGVRKRAVGGGDSEGPMQPHGQISGVAGPVHANIGLIRGGREMGGKNRIVRKRAVTFPQERKNVKGGHRHDHVIEKAPTKWF